MGRPVKKSLIDLVYIHPQTGGQHLITKQKGSRRYECQGNGNTVFRLVATNSPLINQAYMLAYDSHNNEYFVTKLTRHHATVIRYQQNGVNPWEFADPTTYPNGQIVKWDPWHNAVENISVNVQNDN